MKCPFCSAPDTKVINSRPANSDESIRRRRECEVCEGRFTTFETLEKTTQKVVKRDKSKVDYSRDRLLNGIEKACKKRPVTEQQVEAMVNAIEQEAFAKSGDVTTMQLGEMVMAKLLEVDKVAYLRFASVYKDFADVEDFRSEIKALGKG
ncbi:transcriptional regulator NrdR [soil metagenome]